MVGLKYVSRNIITAQESRVKINCRRRAPYLRLAERKSIILKEQVHKKKQRVSGGVLVPGHKYPKTGVKEIYGKTSVRVCAPIQMIPLNFRVLMAWDKYMKKRDKNSRASGVPWHPSGSNK